MSENGDKIVNKWNKLVRPFSAYSGQEKNDLLDYAVDIADQVKSVSGFDCMIAYGTLLGATRERDFIPHDDDIDMAIFCGETDRRGVAAACRKVMEHFITEGYDVKGPSYGQFKVFQTTAGGRRLKVEIFASWVEDGKYYLYFAVPGAPIVDSVAPAQEIEFLGRTFLAPSKPEDVLAAVYGEGWRVPDPDFAYDMNGEKWAPFTPLFFSRNMSYWNQYYAARSENPVWALLPSQFCTFVANELPNSAHILEVGCGNGRDSVFFAKSGHVVTAADYSEEGIKVASNLAERHGVDMSAETLNVYDVPAGLAFGEAHRAEFDVVYARFFIHAITEVGESSFLQIARDCLKPGGRLFAEFRTTGDVRSGAGEALSDNERVDGHYRRFIDPESFLDRTADLGFKQEYSVVGRGMAKFRDEDPEVCRVVLVKP